MENLRKKSNYGERKREISRENKRKYKMYIL